MAFILLLSGLLWSANLAVREGVMLRGERVGGSRVRIPRRVAVARLGLHHLAHCKARFQGSPSWIVPQQQTRYHEEINKYENYILCSNLKHRKYNDTQKQFKVHVRWCRYVNVWSTGR